jgi:post-segregation antitoxin (ccd killing protein)
VNVDVDEYAKYYYNSSTEMTVTLPRWLEEYARREKIDISAVIRAYLTDRYNKQHTM